MSSPTPVADPAEAEEFIRLFHHEHPQSGPVHARVAWVLAEIAATGTYQHTSAELAFGARVAWRNAARCIGRLYWRSLQVRDLRAVRNPDAVATHCAEHLRQAYNGGKLRPVISVFAPDHPSSPAPRIWSEQLIRYAGYRQSEGPALGDPRYTGYTEKAIELGWTPPPVRGDFDVLPLIIESVDRGPKLYELPAEVVNEVRLSHPLYPWFADLGLRWHAVPAISNMTMVIGGVRYPAAPFNGWYMGTEIGSRNLADTDRYNMLPEIAHRLGLDTRNDRTLWKDRALVELNLAVLHSYAQAGVTISDHHTESQRFLTHLAKEEKAGRQCPADWSWIVPPLSGGSTPVFHRYYDESRLKPEFIAEEAAVHCGRDGGPGHFVDEDIETPTIRLEPNRIMWNYLAKV
ncbi:nitric oxide synthase oxygenase [Pseudonocardiaceae bacterium YIM PH 21723]|nr:nitric oxide synthase oxygenase [Pseudonocardiaceae bacterium YIM PH 21723]